MTPVAAINAAVYVSESIYSLLVIVMRILQVSHGFPPSEKAGVELYTYYLSRALKERGHSVRIFCRTEDRRRDEFSSFRETVNGLEVTRVVNNLTKVPNPWVYYDNHFFDEIFLETLEEEKPEIVHFQHFIALSANLLRLARERGYPVILTLHDFFVLCHRTHLLKKDDDLCRGPLYGLECVSCLSDFYPSEPRDERTKFLLKNKDVLPFGMVKWTKRFFIPPKYLKDQGYEVFHRYRFMHEMFKIPEVILTPSSFIRDQFLKYYSFIGPRTRVLPLGIPPVKGERGTRAQNGKVRFCYFGNILPLKGVHILIDAFMALPKGKSALTIYGERNPWTAAYYDEVKERADGFSVDFRPPFRREELSEALRDQDVVVLPSICPESFSFVIREAHSMGLPVIASRIGAIPEAIEEGENGLLFEPGNVNALKECMLRFIEEPELAGRMAARAPKVKTMEEHALELEEIYRTLVYGSRSSTNGVDPHL